MSFIIEIDLDHLLAKQRQIALIWGMEDVKEVRPDLSDDQAWEVLQTAHSGHDSTCGITWETLEWIAEDMFGTAPETGNA